MKKRAKVHLLPTKDKRAVIGLTADEKTLWFAHSGVGNSYGNKHLYFTTDDEIKESDWYYWPVTRTVQRLKLTELERELGKSLSQDCKKIIATTDPDLWHSASDKYGQGCALIPKSFIEEYCRKGGVDEVDVEYIVTVPKYELELKVNSRNEITIHPVEEKLYTREEVEQMLHDIVNDSHCKPERIVQPNSNKCAEFVLNWIKKNL